MIVLTDVAEPSDGVRLVQQQVQCYVDDSCIGDGSLCVSERSVTWISRETKKGFSLTYPSIILHAVSTDISTFAYECIYVLVDCSRADLNLAQQELEDQGEDDDSETAPNVGIRFVPTDNSILNEIYKQMCECQELNPDEDDVSDEEEEMEGLAEENELGFAPPNGGSWITAETLANSDGAVELSEEGLATLQRILGGGANRQNQENNEGNKALLFCIGIHLNY
ncbi:unnamed protein product [Auanema sp. JU1783]|nr:unnamed protein product [Auanema sp. JU1783]